jgi:hypothetical protein
VAHNSESGGPPTFLHRELVRIVGASGTEAYDLDRKPIEPERLTGAEGLVDAACPTADEAGWLIRVMIEAREHLGDALEGVWIAEDQLESTGLMEDWDDEEGMVWVPLDRTQLLSWEEQQKVNVNFPVLVPEEEADQIALAAANTLRELTKVEQLKHSYFFDEDHMVMEISIDLAPADDGTSAFDRIVATPKRAWMSGEDRNGHRVARWEQPVGEPCVFLVRGISEAAVTHEFYASPKRPWRIRRPAG